MGRGVWSRWGRRNDRGGWSLEIGHFVSYTVIQRFDDGGQPGLWEANGQRSYLGEYPTREEAMKACEQRLEPDAKMFFEEWKRYLADKAKRKHVST